MMLTRRSETMKIVARCLFLSGCGWLGKAQMARPAATWQVAGHFRRKERTAQRWRREEPDSVVFARPLRFFFPTLTTSPDGESRWFSGRWKRDGAVPRPWGSGTPHPTPSGVLQRFSAPPFRSRGEPTRCG